MQPCTGGAALLHSHYSHRRKVLYTYHCDKLVWAFKVSCSLWHDKTLLCKMSFAEKNRTYSSSSETSDVYWFTSDSGSTFQTAAKPPSSYQVITLSLTESWKSLKDICYHQSHRCYSTQVFIHTDAVKWAVSSCNEVLLITNWCCCEGEEKKVSLLLMWNIGWGRMSTTDCEKVIKVHLGDLRSLWKL